VGTYSQWTEVSYVNTHLGLLTEKSERGVNFYGGSFFGEWVGREGQMNFEGGLSNRGGLGFFFLAERGSQNKFLLAGRYFNDKILSFYTGVKFRNNRDFYFKEEFPGFSFSEDSKLSRSPLGERGLLFVGEIPFRALKFGIRTEAWDNTISGDQHLISSFRLPFKTTENQRVWASAGFRRDWPGFEEDKIQNSFFQKVSNDFFLGGFEKISGWIKLREGTARQSISLSSKLETWRLLGTSLWTSFRTYSPDWKKPGQGTLKWAFGETIPLGDKGYCHALVWFYIGDSSKGFFEAEKPSRTSFYLKVGLRI